MKNKISYLFFLLVLAVGVALDQITKAWAQKKFLIHSSQNAIHSYLADSQTVFFWGSEGKRFLEFSLTYVRNTGAAWGFLSDMNESIRPYFFYGISLFAMLVIFWFFVKTAVHEVWTRVGIAFIFSGAMGNFIDRLSLHYVIDWLHFRWKIFSWYYDFPVFNIADSFVTVGAMMLFLDMALNSFSKS